MKKAIIIMLPFLLFLLCGCGQKLNIDSNVTSIKYNNNPIHNSDYENIVNKVNSLNFYCGKRIGYNDNQILLNTETNIYSISLSNNYYMEYQNNNKYCHTKNKNKVKNLLTELDKLVTKYNDSSFLSITVGNTYLENVDDFIIKIDKSSNYVILNSKQNLSNFKINKIEFNEKGFNEVDLIYQADYIDNNKVVIRIDRSIIPNYKISFNNEYGYNFYILFNENGNNLDFTIN